MKLSLLFTLALSFFATSLYAQQTHTDIPGEVGTPLDFDGAISGPILARIHTLYGGMSVLTSKMQENGLTKFNSVFGVKGAALYNNELVGDGVFPGHSRNLGLQILPFQVELHEGGKVMLKVAAGSFRNMITAYGLGINDDFAIGDAYSVIDNIDIVEYSYDNTNDSLELHKIYLGTIEAKRSIVSNGGNWVGPSAHFGFGTYFGQKVNLEDEDAPDYLKSSKQDLGDWLMKTGGGLAFNVETEKKWRFSGSAIYNLELFDHTGYVAKEVEGKTDLSRASQELKTTVELSKGFDIKENPVRIGLAYEALPFRKDNMKNYDTGVKYDLTQEVFRPVHQVTLRINF